MCKKLTEARQASPFNKPITFTPFTDFQSKKFVKKLVKKIKKTLEEITLT